MCHFGGRLSFVWMKTSRLNATRKKTTPVPFLMIVIDDTNEYDESTLDDWLFPSRRKGAIIDRRGFERMEIDIWCSTGRRNSAFFDNLNAAINSKYTVLRYQLCHEMREGRPVYGFFDPTKTSVRGERRHWRLMLCNPAPQEFPTPYWLSGYMSYSGEDGCWSMDDWDFEAEDYSCLTIKVAADQPYSCRLRLRNQYADGNLALLMLIIQQTLELRRLAELRDPLLTWKRVEKRLCQSKSEIGLMIERDQGGN